MSLSLERPDKSDRGWDEINRKLLFDFSDEGLMVRLLPLTFATGNVVGVSASGPGAEDLSVNDVNPRELVNRLHGVVRRIAVPEGQLANRRCSLCSSSGCDSFGTEQPGVRMNRAPACRRAASAWARSVPGSSVR